MARVSSVSPLLVLTQEPLCSWFDLLPRNSPTAPKSPLPLSLPRCSAPKGAALAGDSLHRHIWGSCCLPGLCVEMRSMV